MYIGISASLRHTGGQIGFVFSFLFFALWLLLLRGEFTQRPH
jgi:hypothetical protein